MEHLQLTEHDLDLARQLVESGMDVDEVADKFDTVASELIQASYPTPFYVKPRLFDNRVKRGVMRIGELCLEKSCPRCNESLPLTAEFWHHDISKVDKCWTMCRACELERRREKTIKAKEKRCKSNR